VTPGSGWIAGPLPEQARTRFYGKYRGIVSAVDATTCRIKAKVPSVFGDTDSGWCAPCVPYAGAGTGFAFLPEPGSGVWVEFEGGDVSYPIWVGCYWLDGQIPPLAGAQVKVVITAAPHMLILDDAKKSITLTDPNDNTVTLDENGITLSKGGQTIVVGADSVSVDDGALEVQ